MTASSVNVPPNESDITSLLNEVASAIDKDYEFDAVMLAHPDLAAMSFIDQDDDDESEAFQSLTDCDVDELYIHDCEMDMVPQFVKPIDRIGDLFLRLKPLGSGISGSVCLAQSVQTHRQYALKQMSQSEAHNFYSFLKEIDILQQLQHPNIIHLESAYISDSSYFLTTPYCSGGTLLERINQLKHFSERDCAHWVKTILHAVSHMHSQLIAHRDLKFRNIVFDHLSADFGTLKLIDFGQSEVVTDKQAIDTQIAGSLLFIPPEMIRHRRKAELLAGDMWSIGVMTFAMIQGLFPIVEQSLPGMLEALNDADWALPWQKDIVIGASCKQFIERLLARDPKQRMTAEEALLHPWIVNQATSTNLGDSYFDKLRALHFESNLQSIMVNVALDKIDDCMEKEEGLSLLRQSTESASTQHEHSMLIQQILSSCKPGVKSRRGSIVSSCFDEADEVSMSTLDICAILDEIDDHEAEIEEEKKMASETISVVKKRVPQLDDAFSNDRFVSILESAPVQFDVDTIVNRITNNGTSPITYRKISMYRGRLPTLEHVDYLY